MTAAQFRKEKTTQHHGTSEKEPFVTFKPKSLGSYGEHPYHYFSDSPKVLDRMKKAGADANAIPVARVISAKLNATSPLDLSNVGELTPREWAAELERRGISIPEKYRDKIERAENQRGKIPAWNFFKTDTGELQAELIKAGYDSVKWKEWGATTTAVFRPDQVLTHRQLVEKAISEGKPVPPRVLADYPDLAKKGASTTPPKFIPDEGAPHASSIESPTPMGGKQGGPEGPGQGRPAGVPGVVEGSGPAGKAPQAEPPRAATPERAKVGEGPSSQGPGAAESTDPTAFTPPEPTGLKHASVAKERERLGLGERVKFGPVHDNQVIDAAVQRHLSDPTYGARLADAISKKPRTLEIEEIADLLVNQRYLLNERARIEEEIVKADESGADAESLRDHLAATLAALEQNFRASEFGGTRQGLAFRARRWMMAEGYTLTEMERSYKAAKGSELTETETAKLKDLSEKIAAAQKQLEAVNKRLSDEARKRVEAEVAAKIRKEKEAEEYRNSRDKTPTDPAGMRKRMLDGIKTSPDDPARWIQEIFKSYVEEGVAKKEPHTPEARERYLDQTLADVNGVLPDMTRQEVSDAITGYGDYRLLSKEEADVRYRQMRGELRELAKLEDVNAKRPPKKTGMERQSPSDEQRRIDKVLAERMKQMGIVVTDPESQLRSALQSRETYYENRIKDLKFEIAKGEVTVKAKGPQPTSAKLDALKKELDTVIKEHKAIFGDPKMSDEARLKAAIKATERADAEIQRRIQSGEWAPTPRERMSLTSPALEAARNKANASRETLKLLRDLDEATTNAKANARADAQIKALNQQIAELEGQVQGSRPLAQQAGAKPEARPDVQALRDRRAELVKLRDRLRTPGKSAEELALQAAKARMLHQMGELSEKIVTGDYAPAGPREGIKLNPELLRLQADLNKYKQAYEAGKRRYDWDRKSLASKAGYYAGDVLNLPKAIRATLDFSAVLRQGGFITLGRPDLAAKNFAPMIRAAVSDSYSRVVWERIKARPNAELYAQSKLYLADNTKLSTQEERFIGHITKHIPGIAGSERAYTTFLNLLRADTFDTLVKLLPEGQRTQSNMEAIANYINVATGRGALGRFEVARPALSTVLWSPGQALSRAQLLAGQPFYRGSAATRKIIAKEYARFGTGLAVFAGIAMAAGFRFGFDPKSSDFGKLIKGDTRIDLMGGMSQWAVLLTRLLSGESSNARGDSQAVRGEAVSFGGDDASDLIWRFVRSKLTPAIGSTINVLAGKNVVGEPTSVGKELRESVTPLVLVDIYEAMKSRGMTEGGILSVFAILGAGVQTYQPRRGAHADIVADLRAGKVRPADVAKLIPGTDKKAERERNAVLQQAAYLDDDAWAFYQMPYEKAVRALEGDAAAAARPARKRAMMPVESYGDVLRKRIEASDLTAEQKKAMKARIPK